MASAATITTITSVTTQSTISTSNQFALCVIDGARMTAESLIKNATR
jgi:hypothetical protein